MNHSIASTSAEQTKMNMNEWPMVGKAAPVAALYLGDYTSGSPDA
jgi:hypothetical protein